MSARAKSQALAVKGSRQGGQQGGRQDDQQPLPRPPIPPRWREEPVDTAADSALATASEAGDVGHFGTARISRDLRFVSVEAGLQQMLGFSAEEFGHLVLADVVHPDDMARLSGGLDRLINREIRGFSVELQLLPKGRAAVWVACQVSAEHDARGGVTHALLNISEIPGFAQTLAALRDSERRHKTLLSNLAGMAYRTRPAQDYTLDYISEGCRELFGLEPEDFMSGRVTPEDLVHPEDFARMRANVDRALAERVKARNVIRVLQPDGSYRWALETCRGVYDESGRLEALEGFITDIHDQKITEERLAESERALREAQELAGLGSWEIDHRSGQVAWSPETYAIFGQNPDELHPTTEIFRGKLLHPEDRAAELAAFDEAIRLRQPYDSVHRIIRPDGEIRYVSERGEITFDRDGNPLRTLGTTLDITDLKRAEQALLEEQAFKNALLESSDFAVVACDTEGRLRLFNRTARDWLGQDAADLPASEWSAHYGLFARDGKTPLKTEHIPLVRVHGGETVRDAELAILRPGLPPRHVLSSGAPLYDATGQKLGAMVIMRDVTRQRLTEASLRQRDAILSAVAFAAERLLTTWDWEQEIDTILSTLGQAMHASRAYVFRNRQRPDGRFLTAMHSEWRAPGIPPSYVWTMPKGFDMAAEGLGHWAERLRMGGVMQARSRDFLPAEQSMMETDGVKGVVAIPIFVHGDWWGILGFNDCETDRQWSLAEQEALRAAANTLASAIERRLQQEDRLARVVAEEASQAKSAFLATMSHEIRTPMNAILGLAEVLNQSPLTEEQTDLLAAMREAGGHLLHLIDDILDISKIEAGQLQIHPAATDISTTVEAVVGSLVNTAVDRGVALHAFVAPDLPRQIMSDGLRLRQMIYNLLGNAIKFSTDLPDRSGRVELRVDAEEGSPFALRITVRDNGIGMSEELMARIFEPFQQGDSQATRRYGGTGLGLTITRRILALMGGTISAFSSPGEGSTFTIHLPVQALGRSGAHAKPAEAPLQGLGCIVHPSPNYIAADLESYLRHAGANILPATSEPGADGAPAVVICGAEARVPGAQRGMPRLLIELGRGPRRARRAAPLTAVLEGTGLSYANLVQAVLIAAGQADPYEQATGASDSAMMALARRCSSERPVLVAEDDPLNQKVILRQLSLLGINAELASNGADALALARSGRHAMLLTDLHMPDMDGYELARQIRQEEAVSGLRMPIIALTADARQPVADAVKAAGIDALQIKPVTLDSLCQALRPYLAPGDEPSPPGEKPPASRSGADNAALDAAQPMSTEPVLDLSALSARLGDDPEIQQEFLAAFLEHLAPLAVQLQSAADASDLPAAGGLAHRLKSSARAIGAMQLGAICAAIESKSRDNDRPAFYNHMAQFEKARHDAERAISVALGRGKHEGS